MTPANLRLQILDHAHSIAGLDLRSFERCLAQGGGKALVDRELAFANANGIEATPTVFLNGKETQVVAPEQLLTIVRELSASPASVDRRTQE